MDFIKVFDRVEAPSLENNVEYNYPNHLINYIRSLCNGICFTCNIIILWEIINISGIRYIRYYISY